MALTLSDAETKLAQYLAAEEAVLTGQSYSIAGRSLTRADLEYIQKGVKLWNDRCLEFGADAQGRRVIKGGTPFDG